MGIFFNRGTKWATGIFILHVALFILIFDIDPQSATLNDIGAVLFNPFFFSITTLCGLWDPGIFGRCGSNDILALVVGGFAVLTVYCIIGSIMYWIVRKMKSPTRA